MSLTNDYLHQHQMVSASASLLLIFGIGTIVGPIAGTAAMSLLGPEGLFVFAASAMALLALFGLLRHLTAKRFPVDEQTEYVPMAAGTTPEIYRIDPRNEDYRPAVLVPHVERRQRQDRRAEGPTRGGRRRTDAADFNE